MIRRVSPRLAAVATVLAVGVSAACGREEASTPDPTTADLLSSDIAERGQTQQRLSAPQRPVSLDDLGYDVGDPDAPVRLVEFSDFGCGYCRRFHQDVWPVLEREYVETGKVYWKYVPMVLGMFPHAVEAAQAGECAGEQGRFRPMQDRLFADQGSWKNADEPMPPLEAIATDVGLDVGRWRSCIDEGRRNDRVATGTQLSREAGVRGTPTFFVVGYAPIPGALPLELFREVLDTAYAQAVRGDGPAGG